MGVYAPALGPACTVLGSRSLGQNLGPLLSRPGQSPRPRSPACGTSLVSTAQKFRASATGTEEHGRGSAGLLRSLCGEASCSCMTNVAGLPAALEPSCPKSKRPQDPAPVCRGQTWPLPDPWLLGLLGSLGLLWLLWLLGSLGCIEALAAPELLRVPGEPSEACVERAQFLICLRHFVFLPCARPACHTCLPGSLRHRAWDLRGLRLGPLLQQAASGQGAACAWAGREPWVLRPEVIGSGRRWMALAWQGAAGASPGCAVQVSGSPSLS